MFLLKKKYFKPTKALRSLAVLEFISGSKQRSQQEIGQRAGMSPAMANSYISGLVEQGLMRYEPVNGKSYRYLLTEAGEQERQRAFGEYCAEIVQAYTALKCHVRKKMSPLAARGLTRLVLFGASESCEIVISSLKGEPLKILCLVDNDPAKHGEVFHGYVICPPEILRHIKYDVLVISSFGRQEEIYAEFVKTGILASKEVVRI